VALIFGLSWSYYAAWSHQVLAILVGDGECKMRDGRLTNRTIDKAVIALLFVGLFCYVSTRPTYRLSVDMPPQFRDAPASWPPQKREAEEKVARAYWYCAVTEIQPKYGFGEPLPLNPPPEFTIITPGLAKGATDSETRLRYWHKLQQSWYLASTWTKVQTWNFQWLTVPVEAGVRRWHNYVQRFLGT
jgi:hypothetical protein